MQICRAISRRTWCGLRRWCSNESGGARFSTEHEWVRIEGQSPPTKGSIAVVGISKWAAEALGEVVFAQLPAASAKVTKGAECGALESVKAASELYSPVTGIVTTSNSEVETAPALINRSCYGDGWLFKLKLDNPSEFDSLMTESQYEEFLKKDAH